MEHVDKYIVVNIFYLILFHFIYLRKLYNNYILDGVNESDCIV